jgi:two-component system, OmpR family, KDP operon response regulator KdpE
VSSGRILVIDDEEQIRKLLDITLRTNGFLCTGAATAKEGVSLAKSNHYDLILLDIGLPDESGHQVLKKLRAWHTTPIVILSVQSEEESIVAALDNGANDYLVKPFRVAELLARIRACLRQTRPDATASKLHSGEMEIDLQARTVLKSQVPVKLTQIEYHLLSLLAENEGKVLTHQFLLRSVWGPGYIGQTQNLRVHIAALRKKIETDPTQPSIILTESGVGYRLVSSSLN